jgi:hypothetical protein
MTITNSNIKIISPFFERIARNFDLLGFFDDFALPPPSDNIALLQDWRAIHLDYNNSLKVFNEELNANQKKSGK